jgi:hypothetical protein
VPPAPCVSPCPCPSPRAVALLLLVCVGLIFGCRARTQGLGEGPPAPAIVDYGPTGDVSAYPTIEVRFNRPMVPVGAKQRVDAKQAGFRIEPAIEGDAYWAAPTRLVFEPKAALPDATE